MSETCPAMQDTLFAMRNLQRLHPELQPLRRFMRLVDVLPDELGEDVDRLVAALGPEAVERHVVLWLQRVVVRTQNSAERGVRKPSELSCLGFPSIEEGVAEAMPAVAFQKNGFAT